MGVSAFQALKREWSEIALLLTYLFSPLSRSVALTGTEESRAGVRRAVESRAIGPGGPMEARGLH
jgi:hypothetical protein